jgi:hypothetical protein
MKKKTKKILDVISKLTFPVVFGLPSPNDFGTRTLGMSDKEIEEYLMARKKYHKKKWSLKTTLAKFNKAAGVNTCAICQYTGEILMYRHDVERFADVIFLGTKTYWD